MSMRSMIFSALVCACVPTLACAQTAYTAWKCSAPGLRAAKYDGGEKAYVHLEGFSHGGTYKVIRKGKIATGTTANGTSFTCTQPL